MQQAAFSARGPLVASSALIMEKHVCQDVSPSQAENASSPPTDSVSANVPSAGSARRTGLLRFLPHFSILVVLGALYLTVEVYSFSGVTGGNADGRYRALAAEGGATSSAAGQNRRPPVARRSQHDTEWLNRHADELGCDFQFQKVNPECPRFVHLPVTRGGGLGNKYFTYILGMLLAMDLKATHLYTGDEFRYSDHQDHGNYPWVEEVLMFGYREMNYSRALDLYKPEVVQVGHQVWENITRDYADRCNVLFMADDYVCNYMVCYYSNTPRVYQRIKSVTRCKVMHSQLPPPVLKYTPDTYNVAWHIRMGDTGDNARLQSIHANDRGYYERCQGELNEILRGFTVTYHFFAESPDSGNNPPPGFEFLSKFFPNAVYHTSMPPMDAVLHMMSADMLITSGSSFSFVPASMSYKPVVLFDRPKEGFFFGVYMDEDYVRLDNGRVADQSLSEVRATVMYKYALYHDHMVPGTISVRNSTSYEYDIAAGNLGAPKQKADE